VPGTYKAWTSNTQGTTTFNSVAYSGEYWVAVGNTGTLYYKQGSPSGAWTSNSQGSTTFRSVEYGNGYWVAVGDSGTLYYKSGANPAGAWTSNAQGSDNINAVIYANGNWVCAGARYIRYHASDPTGAWTTGLDLTTSTGQNTFWGLGYDGTYLVAVGGQYSTKQHRSATDPSAWTSRSDGSQMPYYCAVGGPVYDGTINWAYGEDSLGSGFVRYQTQAEMLASSLVTTSSPNSQAVIRDMCFDTGSGWWVLVGDGGKLRATATHPGTYNYDATEWANNPQGSSALYGVAYGAVAGTHTWVAVGASGTLYYTTNYPLGPSLLQAGLSNQSITSPMTITDPGNQRWAGQLEYLLVEYHPGNAVTVSDSSWTSLGTQEISAQTGLAIWWRVLATDNATCGNVSQTTTDHLAAHIVQVLDVDNHTGAIPYSVSSFSQDTGSNTSVSVAGVTTTQDDELVMVIVTTGFDPGSNVPIISGWTNASLDTLTEGIDWGHTTGNGGGLAMAFGRKTTPGASGTTTATLVNAAQKCHNVHSHKPKKKPVVVSNQAEKLMVTASPQRW